MNDIFTVRIQEFYGMTERSYEYVCKASSYEEAWKIGESIASDLYPYSKYDGDTGEWTDGDSVWRISGVDNGHRIKIYFPNNKVDIRWINDLEGLHGITLSSQKEL